MKVLMIGSDRAFFRENSPVRKRALAYAKYFEELHVVVFAKKSLGLKKQKIANNVWIYPTNSINRWLYVFGAERISKKIIQDWDKNDSVISTQDPFEAGIVGVKLKGKFGIPLQFQVHTDFLSPYFVQGYLNTFRVHIASRILQHADGIRVVSKRVKDAIISKYSVIEEKITVLPIFVDVHAIANNNTGDNFKARYPEFKFIILMMSRLTHEKNISQALDIFQQINENNRDVGLIIVGEGPEKSILERRVEELNLDGSVYFESWSNDVSAYYNTADVFLLTSFVEGYGMTLIEAGAHRVPIVTSDVGVVGDTFTDGQELSVCAVGNTECFVDKLQELIDDKGLRLKYQVNFESVLQEEHAGNFDEYTQEFHDSLARCISQRE